MATDGDALSRLEAQMAAMRLELDTLRDVKKSSTVNSKAIGNEAERHVSELLQCWYPDSSVTSTSRDGLSGDLRLELGQGGDPVPLLVEVKRHQATVSRREVESFIKAVNAQGGCIAGAVFISLTSNIATQPCFSIALSDDGATEMVFVTHAEEEPHRIRLAVEFLLARHRQQVAQLECQQQIGVAKGKRLLRQVAQIEAALHRKLQLLTVELGKLSAVAREADATLR
jgi:hypothetical protein